MTGGRDPLDVARAALVGGAHILQLRDKTGDKGQTLPLAVSLRELCDRNDALLVVNDHADVATLSGAHGLHVGQTDLPVPEARRVLGPGQIIGRSNHLLDEVRESRTQGADHVALGNVYRTSTKESIRNRPPLGPEAVRRARAAAAMVKMVVATGSAAPAAWEAASMCTLVHVIPIAALLVPWVVGL